MTLLQRLLGTGAVAVLSLTGTPSWAQEWQWATAVQATATTTSGTQLITSATAMTASGNVVAAYRHRAAITLGSQAYPANTRGMYNCELVRHGPGGAVVGSPLLVGVGASVSDLRTDADGNLYAAGWNDGRLTVGGTAYGQINRINADLFVAKWDSTGALRWIQFGYAVGTTNVTNTAKVGIDSSGHVTVAAGLSAGRISFGTDTLTLPTAALVLAQFDAAGTRRWARASTAAPQGNTVDDLAVAPNGTLYVVGPSNRVFSWGSTVVASMPGRSAYWLKLAPNGQLLAQQRFGWLVANMSQVATDGTGACYVLQSGTPPAFGWGASVVTLPPHTNALFVARLTAAGTLDWVRPVTVPDTSCTVHGNQLRVVNDLPAGGMPRVYVGGGFNAISGRGTMTCGSLTLSSRSSRITDGFVLALDGHSGAPLWLKRAGGTNFTDDVMTLDATARGQLSVGGYYGGDTAYFGGIQVLNTHSLWSVAYTARLLQGYNQLQGTAFTDLNTNGARDAGEFGRGGVVVEAQPGPVYFTTEASGQYSAIADLGTYTLSVPNPPRYHVAAIPIGPATTTFSTYGNISAGHDFALQPIANQQDLVVRLTPVNRPMPGFAMRYHLTCHNVGTMPIATPVLHLAYDPLLAYVSSTQAVVQTGTSLTWSLAALQPGETRTVDVLFQLAAATPIGYQLTATAVLDPVSGDLTPADNTEVAMLPVTSSYDPNDITVNYASLTLSQVQNATRPLDYTVRFQNTGTDTAFTVTMRDTLPAALLNLGTLELLAASHSCIWRLDPGGVLTVTFPNIRLPGRMTNTPQSMGYARFRLVPYTTLALGDQIPNRAALYFDFNPPVTTNTALTRVQNATGLPTAATELMGRAWPNPTTGALHVTVERPAGEALTLTLTDAVGRVVRTQTVQEQTEHVTVDVRNLAPGLYGVRAVAGGRQWSERVVVQ